MAKTKTVKMPAGIRTKLMAAVAMLLVSTILMVSSTYAWFTLSTAPEVTGITTSVGANGNLEIALLNGYTYTELKEITSGQGTSIAATGDVTQSNITWGNLVDLSDVSYGLNLVALNPAALNNLKLDGSQEPDKTKVDTAFLLQTAEYGADGRVAELNANTITGVYNSTNGKWVGTQTISDTPYPAYGVRAIGVDSSMTTAEIVLTAAKSAVNSGKNGAASPISNAVAIHKETFLGLAMSMNKTDYTYDPDDYAALKAVAEGVQSSLNAIVKTYSNAVLAKLASTEGITDEVLTDMRSQLSGNTSATNLKELMNTANVTDTTYTDRLTDLEDAQAEVAGVLALFTVADDGTVGTIANLPSAEGEAATSVDVKKHIVTPLIGITVKAYDANGGDASLSVDDAVAGKIKSVYLTSGLVATVAADVGTYMMVNAYDVPVYASTVDNVNKPAATGNLATIAGSMATLNPPTGGTAEKTIADFYGYVIDFAFRTNAAGSSLQLQTIPANRVYSNAEGTDLATQGAGSTATFTYDSALNADQVKTLLGAVRLVFMDPEEGTVYATAGLTDMQVGATEATANVELTNLAEGADVDNIVALEQNVAKKVSVLVYLDGEEVDNGDVAATAASSGTLNLNLQFSSSANLVPMQNTTLQNMVLTYTELATDEYKAGLYTYGNVVYTVKENYKIYEGSNGMIYFSADASVYTKLTAINVADALTALKVDFTAEKDVIPKGGNLTVTAAMDANTVPDNTAITKVEWTSVDTAVATVPADDDTTNASINVTGVAAGTTKINAAIDLKVTYKDSDGNDKTYEETVYASYTVTVSAETTQQGGTTTYNVTVPTGVTGANTATAGQDYTFTVADGYTLGEVTVDGTPVTIDSTTIPAASVTGDIVITATANTYGVTNGSATLISVADSAKTGETVTVTVVDGVTTVTGVTVAGSSGDAVTVTNNNGTYTFTMPAEKVTVTATTGN